MLPLDALTSISEDQSQVNNRRERTVGFDAKNKDSVTLYICHICNLILRYPCQLNCGHRVCQLCFESEEGSTIKCSKCNEETSKERVIPDKGCRHDMETLPISCSLCEWNGLFKDYQNHLEQIHANPYCKYCGQGFDSVLSYTQHTSECEKTPMDCTLKSFGCDEQFLRMNTRDHLLSKQHQSLLLKLLMQKPLDPMDDTDNEQSASSYTTVSINRKTDDTSDGNFPELDKMMEQVMNGFQALTDDTQRLSSESLRCVNMCDNVFEDLSKVKLAVQETDSLLNAHKSNQQILEQSLASLQQEINDLKNASYDGTILWKITNFGQKIADAQSERQTSIYSPVFYSSPSGYKMRVRLYPVGDGNARGTHMSMFFVLMRGEYDAVLQFPFNFKITFCLFDQTPQQRHLIDSFRPDTKSNSFQRPCSNMNIASGIPKFCPSTIIQQDNNSYVRDDTILIKIVVDFGAMPRTVLPHALSINPGLPLLVQYESIKREVEKQAQENSSNISATTNSIKIDTK